MTWVFGYGSLIWRPGFVYEERRLARVLGWRRRFWQASPDHRGVPGRPGRVVTLIEEADASCWGVAFRLAPGEHPRIMSELDHRERNGYERVALDIELAHRGCAAGVTYVAGPRNPSFVGPAPVAEMARQIATAVGPSGTNREYLLRLAETLDELGVTDDEVEALRRAVLALGKSPRAR